MHSAWAGAVVHTNDGQVTMTVIQKRWDNTHSTIRRTRAEHEAPHAEKEGGGPACGPKLGLVHIQLERDRGFLI
jgi:hypothetical protein